MTAPALPLRPADWFPLRLHDDPDHHIGLARHRARTPVEQVAAFGTEEPVWAVYGYDDALAVLTDAERFSVGVVEERYGAVLGRSMLTAAPSVRRALRRVVGTHLHPERAGLGDLVHAVVAARVEELAAAGDGPVDLAPLLAGQVPARVLARLLGLPEDDWVGLAGLAAAAAGLLADPRAALRAARALRRSLAGQVQHARRGCGDDVVTALTRVDLDGRALDDGEVVASLMLLAWAGTETAFPAILTCLHAVLAHVDAEAALRADPGLVPAAVDEALRWESPVQVTSRTAEVAVDVGGIAVPAGATLLVHLGAANRDPRRFPEPDRFDVTRADAAASLAFGSGVHRCLGWQLARVEVAACVRALLDRFPRLRLDPGSPPPEGQVLRSPRRLLVHLS